MKAIYINVLDNEVPRVVDINPELEDIYNLIKCDSVDFATRVINKKRFTFICDDIGLLKKKPIASVINDNFKVEFVGNVLIFGYPDDYGELTGLTKQDIKDILTLKFKIYDNKKDFHYGLIIKSV